MSEKIKRINRELKFKGKILDFYQDTIEVDGDHTVVWDFIGHKGAAAVVPVTADGKILMVRQYRLCCRASCAAWGSVSLLSICTSSVRPAISSAPLMMQASCSSRRSCRGA